VEATAEPRVSGETETAPTEVETVESPLDEPGYADHGDVDEMVEEFSAEKSFVIQTVKTKLAQ
jgi:hypothetical protein